MTARRILVVEDDPDIQESLELFLVSEGYTVDTAFDGQQALDYLQRGGRPTAILLDLMMPVMNGYDLLERLRGSKPEIIPADTPIILLSAASDAERVSRQWGLPCVRKPFRLQALSEQLAKVCRGE